MKILGHEIGLDDVGTMDDIGAFGKYHPRPMKIQIAADVAPSQRESTVIHEVLEVINQLMVLDLPHDVLSRLEAGLYSVISDNGIDISPLFK